MRRTAPMRRMVAETRLTTDDLIAPLFVREGITEPQPIESLPGVVQHTRESLRKEVAELAALGVPGVILFGVPATKDAEGSGAWDPDGIVQVALRDLRDDVGDDLVGSDLPDPTGTVLTRFVDCVATAPDTIALIDNDTETSYAELAAAVASLAARISERGPAQRIGYRVRCFF